MPWKNLDVGQIFRFVVIASGSMASKKSLQVTFDPLPIFAAAKTAVDSNAPEFRR